MNTKTLTIAATLALGVTALAASAGAQLSSCFTHGIVSASNGAPLGAVELRGKLGTPQAREFWRFENNQWPDQDFRMVSIANAPEGPVDAVFTSERFGEGTAALPEDVGADERFYDVVRCNIQDGCELVAYLFVEGASDPATSRLSWYATQALAGDDMIEIGSDDVLVFDKRIIPPQSNLQYPVITQDAL